jgi:hypothetical protein
MQRLLRWLRSAFQPGRTARRHPAKPFLEALEGRTLLSHYVFFPGPYQVPAHNPDTALGPVQPQPVIDTGSTPLYNVEPQVAINPTNPQNVVVSSQNGLVISTDGGKTFGAPIPFAVNSGSDDGDTSIVFDSKGRLFWANLSDDGLTTTAVWVAQLNPTTGELVGTPNIVNVPPPPTLSTTYSDDKEFLTVDSHDNLYVAWTRFTTFAPRDPRVASTTSYAILLSRSTDQGQTWSAPVTVSDPTGSEGFVWGVTVSVAPSGDVYVAYHSQTGYESQAGLPLSAPDGVSGQVIVARYTNDLSQPPAKSDAFGPGAADITFNLQTAPRGIPGIAAWAQGSSQPWVLADPTRPHHVYVVAATDPNHGAGGDAADVVFATSGDDGRTWQTKTLGFGANDGSDQLFPTAAIDPFGDIVVAWYDNHNGARSVSGGVASPDNAYLLDVFAEYSTDGGQTWSSVFQVNNPGNSLDSTYPAGTPIHYDSNGNPAAMRIGEYFGVALFGDTAYVAWNGNVFNNGNINNPIGHQVWFNKFAINGTLLFIPSGKGGVGGPNGMHDPIPRHHHPPRAPEHPGRHGQHGGQHHGGPRHRPRRHGHAG